MVTTGGKVVFGKYAQITNNPENASIQKGIQRGRTSATTNPIQASQSSKYEKTKTKQIIRAALLHLMVSDSR
jgi:hypothetical protein